MTRRELVLKKLTELPNDEVENSVKQLTLHVQARLFFNSMADRTKTGAHSENNLGMPALDYYVGESIRKLYSPDDGWDWKFEKFTLVEQLTRIANSLISRKVAQYKYTKEKQKLPVFDERDINDIHDLGDEHLDEGRSHDIICQRLVDLAFKVSEDNEALSSFTVLYFDNEDFPSIADKMQISIKDVYALRKKLVRRLMKHKENLKQE